MDGQIQTDYTPGGTITFLANPEGLWVGLDSGSYRPNPAAFNSATTSTSAPYGQYTNTTTDAAVFGGRLRTALLAGTFDATYFSINDVNYDASSAILPIGGSMGAQTFAANSVQFGMSSALFNFDGLSLPGIGQALPDILAEEFVLNGTNTATTATIVPYGIGYWQMTIPVNVLWSIDLGDGAILPLQATGTIVAVSVPEPSTGVLAIVAIVGATLCGRSRRRQTQRSRCSVRRTA